RDRSRRARAELDGSPRAAAAGAAARNSNAAARRLTKSTKRACRFSAETACRFSLFAQVPRANDQVHRWKVGPRLLESKRHQSRILSCRESRSPVSAVAL